MLENRLRVLMAERYLTATKLAKLTGISRNTIQSIKANRNKQIRIEVLDKLLKTLDVSPNDFFEGWGK